MAFMDMDLAKLKVYKPDFFEAGDFDSFWLETLSKTREKSAVPVLKKTDVGLKTIDTWDLQFGGYMGQPVRGWVQAPAGAEGPLPCVVEFIGYGGGRGFAWDWLLWPSAGYVHLVMDTRGQGSGWMKGDTPDSGSDGEPAHEGFMTRGIQDPAAYYYRRVFSDAVMAVECARSLEMVDAKRVAVSGGSQGGGISLAVAGLLPDIAACMPDVPFLCHMRRATEMTDAYPYQEISKYLQVHRDKVEQTFKTLSYFDGVNFAKRAQAPALFSVGLMDETCPPSTVYAAYNHYSGEKKIIDWVYNRHEGGGSYQVGQKLEFLAKVLA